MTENEMERVVRMAAAFPWAEYNRERPITSNDVQRAFRSELTRETLITNIDRALELAGKVAKLVNERPADPFEGIA